MADPHAIARRLTVAQRDLIMWISIQGTDFCPFPPSMEAIAVEMEDQPRAARLVRTIDHGDCTEYQLTPLGAQVRAIVEQKQGGGDAS